MSLSRPNTASSTSSRKNQKSNNRIDLTDHQKRQIRQVFNCYDIDNTGVIDIKDLKKALKIVCPEIYIQQSEYNQEKDLMRLFKKLQIKNEQSISQYQFLQIVKAKIVLDRPDYSNSDLVNFFNFVDKGQKGFINIEDLEKICRNLNSNIYNDITSIKAVETTLDVNPNSNANDMNNAGSSPRRTPRIGMSMNNNNQKPKPAFDFDSIALTLMIEETSKMNNGNVSLSEFLNMMKRAHRL